MIESPHIDAEEASDRAPRSAAREAVDALCDLSEAGAAFVAVGGTVYVTTRNAFYGLLSGLIAAHASLNK